MVLLSPGAAVAPRILGEIVDRDPKRGSLPLEVEEERFRSVAMGAAGADEDFQMRCRLLGLYRPSRHDLVGVPTFVIGTQLIVGFRSADTTGRTIREKLDHPFEPYPGAGPAQTASRPGGSASCVLPSWACPFLRSRSAC